MGWAAQAAVALRAVSSRTARASAARPTARPVGAEAGDARRDAAAAVQAGDAGETWNASEAGEFIISTGEAPCIRLTCEFGCNCPSRHEIKIAVKYKVKILMSHLPSGKSLLTGMVT